MKQAVIYTFVLALIGGGLFLVGVSKGIDSFEMTGFILTLPITFIAALGLATVVLAAIAGALLWLARHLLVCSKVAWSALVWLEERASIRRRRG